MLHKQDCADCKVFVPCVQTEAVNKVPEEKKTEVKKQTSRNYQQRLENIVKQTVVESRVKHLY